MDREEQLEHLKKLAQLMKDADLSEISLEEGDRSIRLRRGPRSVSQVVGGDLLGVAPARAGAAASSAGGDPVAAPDGTVTINSPMVGTFYRAPSPDSDTFVEIGAVVDEDSTVCIVEAMKVMNEIKAELRGEIVEILVEDASAVQFGTPLFRVRPH